MSFLTNMFGDTQPQAAPPTTPTGFSGGGLTASFGGNSYGVTADANRTGAVSNLAGTYGDLGNTYGDLLKTVAPGASASLTAQLQDQDNQARSAIGNLKQNLQARRILGSSFGQDTISRANNTVQQQRDATIAQNYQQEFENTSQTIAAQHAAYAQQYQTGLDELNLESGTASGLVSGANSVLMNNQKLLQDQNQFNATMANNQASGFGKVLGGAASIALGPVTGGASLAMLPMFTGQKNAA